MVKYSVGRISFQTEKMQQVFVPLRIYVDTSLILRTPENYMAEIKALSAVVAQLLGEV